MPPRLLATYAPGTNPQLAPAGTAFRLEPGGILELQMHYTTTGEAATDRTRVGLVLATEPSPREIRASHFFNATLRLPPGAAAVPVETDLEFLQPTTVWGLFPHTHLRGKNWEYKLVLPDGTARAILSVPRYDFNWQTYYIFAEPLEIPAGARIVSTAWYDNSAANRSNPDPTVEVRCGNQTWEEMQYTGILFSPLKPAGAAVRKRHQPIEGRAALRARAFLVSAALAGALAPGARAQIDGEIEPFRRRDRMLVREERQVAADDEQVQRPLVQVGKGMHRFARPRVAHAQAEPARPMPSGRRPQERLESVLADRRRRNPHQLHRADGARASHRPPDVRMHRAPEPIRAVRVARDFDPHRSGREERRRSRASDLLRAAGREHPDHRLGIVSRKAHVIHGRPQRAPPQLLGRNRLDADAARAPSHWGASEQAVSASGGSAPRAPSASSVPRPPSVEEQIRRPAPHADAEPLKEHARAAARAHRFGHRAGGVVRPEVDMVVADGRGTR